MAAHPASGPGRAASDAGAARTAGAGVATATLQRMGIDRVFVAGAGLMGHGIGQVHAAIGKRVTLYEP